MSQEKEKKIRNQAVLLTAEDLKKAWDAKTLNAVKYVAAANVLLVSCSFLLGNIVMPLLQQEQGYLCVGGAECPCGFSDDSCQPVADPPLPLDGSEDRNVSNAGSQYGAEHIRMPHGCHRPLDAESMGDSSKDHVSGYRNPAKRSYGTSGKYRLYSGDYGSGQPVYWKFHLPCAFCYPVGCNKSLV